MKTYKSSDLTHKRAEVLKEARNNGVVIQECNTNGEVRQEYVIQVRTPLTEFSNEMSKHSEKDNTLWNEDIIKGEHHRYKFDHIKKALKEIEGDL